MTPWLVAAVYAVLAIALMEHRASALPSFSRKYHMPCSGCHDAPLVPRLNDVGYKFRRAGFRMPEQIGQEEAADFTLGNYFSAHVALGWSLMHTNDRSDLASSRTDDRFSVDEVSFHPLTGSFAKHWATQTDLSFSFEEGVSIENAYLRGACTNPVRAEEASGARHRCAHGRSVGRAPAPILRGKRRGLLDQSRARRRADPKRDPALLPNASSAMARRAPERIARSRRVRAHESPLEKPTA